MNGLGKKKVNEKHKIKKSGNQSPNSSNELKTGILITEPPVKKKGVKEDPQLKEKEEEELKKQKELTQQIQELNEKLQFEQEQRKKIIDLKKEEIKNKENTITQIQKTNEQLENELKTLEVQVQQNLDKMEPKEKNDGFENEKKKRETPLEQRLKVKEQELARFISANINTTLRF